jgi:hypothetical protein
MILKRLSALQNEKMRRYKLIRAGSHFLTLLSVDSDKVSFQADDPLERNFFLKKTCSQMCMTPTINT